MVYLLKALEYFVYSSFLLFFARVWCISRAKKADEKDYWYYKPIEQRKINILC